MTDLHSSSAGESFIRWVLPLVDPTSQSRRIGWEIDKRSDKKKSVESFTPSRNGGQREGVWRSVFLRWLAVPSSLSALQPPPIIRSERRNEWWTL